MDQTLYEIADDFEAVLDLMDDLTNPLGPSCRTCNPDGLEGEEYFQNLRATGQGETCRVCGGTGRNLMADDDGILEAIGIAMDDIEMSLSEKTENIMRLIQSWTVMETAIKKEEKRLHAKRKAYENKRARLKAYLSFQMKRVGQKKIETPIKNAYLYKGRPSVIIDDEDILPQGTFDTEMIIKPDKKLIYERLKKKIETPGAHIEVGDPYVVFR